MFGLFRLILLLCAAFGAGFVYAEITRNDRNAARCAAGQLEFCKT